MRPGGTKRQHLFDALGVSNPNDLLRICERATENRPAACMLFWTLGGNQVGKAAISGWREVIIPNLGSIGLWPFDGKMEDVLNDHSVVIAETYPGDVYGQIGLPSRPVWSKRKRAGRKSVSNSLIDWASSQALEIDDRLTNLICEGFADGPEGEDKFDAFVGLLGMLGVVGQHIPEGVPDNPDITVWEGWILGHNRLDELKS